MAGEAQTFSLCLLLVGRGGGGGGEVGGEGVQVIDGKLGPSPAGTVGAAST